MTALTVGDPAPLFALPSVEGTLVDLAAYRGRRHVIVWLSRGFTCPFCLAHMDGIRAGYDRLVVAGAEVIQIAPNLPQAARAFFGGAPAPFPFVCDPDKRLYARYGLGDRGVLEATRTALASVARARAQGEGGTLARGLRADVLNRRFLRRVHHHAMTALEQGVFLVDRDGILRHAVVVGPIDPLPDAARLVELVGAYCRGARVA